MIPTDYDNITVRIHGVQLVIDVAPALRCVGHTGAAHARVLGNDGVDNAHNVAAIGLLFRLRANMTPATSRRILETACVCMARSGFSSSRMSTASFCAMSLGRTPPAIRPKYVLVCGLSGFAVSDGAASADSTIVTIGSGSTVGAEFLRR